jgi:hypothetical protein
MAEVRFLRAAVNNIAIRDEVGSTDRIGDFGIDDAIKLVISQPPNAALPEWVEVTMVGAVRAPAEEGVARQDVCTRAQDAAPTPSLRALSGPPRRRSDACLPRRSASCGRATAWRI